jgi:hypothetical protein
MLCGILVDAATGCPLPIPSGPSSGDETDTQIARARVGVASKPGHGLLQAGHEARPRIVDSLRYGVTVNFLTKWSRPDSLLRLLLRLLAMKGKHHDESRIGNRDLSVSL